MNKNLYQAFSSSSSALRVHWRY